MSPDNTISVTCRLCGAANSPTAQNCGECGTSLQGAAPFQVACGSCGGTNPAGARYCNSCGAYLSRSVAEPAPPAGPGAPPPPGAPALPSSFGTAYDTAPRQYTQLDEEEGTARGRTVTGLSLLIVGFALGWIPYVSIIAGILALIGLIFLFLGRWGFDYRHHSYVVGGIFLLFLTLVAAFFVTIGFVFAVAGDAQTTSSLSSLSATIQGQFDAFLIATAVLGIISGFAHVLIPYGLADRRTQGLLWAAFAFQLVISVVVLVLILPMVNSAVASALSGTTFDPGPINDLQTTSTIYGALAVFPSLVFAWAYYRARSTALEWTGAST